MPSISNALALQAGPGLLRSAQGTRSSAGSSRAYSLTQLLLVGLLHTGITCARPVGTISNSGHDDEHVDQENPTLWIYLTTAIVLVLLGGAFAGLTIALMGQDELYLQVIATSGEGAEKQHAKKVLRLLKKGKHWVLVTLLVGNVITNETLPIVLDHSIGGGYAAAISSTILVIIFGEIVPQSICVRYGLPIGAWMAPLVLGLMWIFAPITWPIAKLLDYLLGEEHGTTYKKAGLKTLVTLHKTMGGVDGERLNEDEVSIISGVLDLKAKPVGSIMTPMNDVFTLPSDAILDEEMMDDIMREGYSRIPIHEPANKTDFVGMLLVKMLITYDPEDARKVSEFQLATLPETSPDTSCLDIINFFQEGKSHMVLVSDFPGKTYGALGVVTLEDVIEELIGEEIIDESDVFIDIHKAIRRTHLAPLQRARPRKGEVVTDPAHNQATGDEAKVEQEEDALKPSSEGHNHGGSEERPSSRTRPSVTSVPGKPQRMGTYLMRRTSSGSGSRAVQRVQMAPPDLREHMRKLGPSNLASRPKQTRVNTVKIKPGVGMNQSNGDANGAQSFDRGSIDQETIISPGIQAKDGVQALQTRVLDKGTAFKPYTDEPDEDELAHASSSAHGKDGQEEDKNGKNWQEDESTAQESTDDAQQSEQLIVPSNRPRSDSHSTVASLISQSEERGTRSKSHGRRKTGTARSGSITENVIEAGGVKKLVLETTKCEESQGSAIDESGHSNGKSKAGRRATSAKASEKLKVAAGDGTNEVEGGEAAAMKKKRKKRTKKKEKAGDENTPLLGKD